MLCSPPAPLCQPCLPSLSSAAAQTNNVRLGAFQRKIRLQRAHNLFFFSFSHAPLPNTSVSTQTQLESCVLGCMSVYKYPFALTKDALLTFCLQLDKVAQRERHGLGIHCVQDLGSGWAWYWNTIVLDVVGHLCWVLWAWDPADAHHLIRKEKGFPQNAIKDNPCLYYGVSWEENYMNGGENLFSKRFNLWEVP